MNLKKFALIVFCAFISLTSFAQKIVINEVHYNPVNSLAGDANGDGVRSSSHDEFIELVNTDTDSVNLKGFTLHDAGGIIYTFADIKLGSYQALVIFGGGNAVPISNVKILTNSLSLNNANNSVFIKNANGIMLDSMSYKTNDGVGVSLVRSPELTGSFVAHNTINSALFSPGKTANNQDFVKPVTGIENFDSAINSFYFIDSELFVNNEKVNALFFDMNGNKISNNNLVDGNVYIAYCQLSNNKNCVFKFIKK